MYDYLFRNANIYDGSGSEPYRANVAVFSGGIALITSSAISRAKNVIDAEDHILMPGIIDMHTHTDLEILRDRDMNAKIRQGITTDVSGNCGIGVFPKSKSLPGCVLDVLGEWDDWNWDDFSSYRNYVEKDGIGINEVFLTSHSALRLAVLGADNAREATDLEINKMCILLSDSIEQGSLGLSSGLYYVPCSFASEKELLALLRTVSEKDALFAVHHRSEGNDVVDSLKEVLELSRKAGNRLEISHLKAIGKRNSDKIPVLLGMIEKYRNEGLRVTFDQYPYTFGSTSLFSLLPPRILGLSKIERRLALALETEREVIKKEMLYPEGWDSVYETVGPDDIRVLFAEHFPEVNGMSLSEIGEIRKADPVDALFDILADETGLAVMSDVTESEDDLKTIMRHHLMGFGTDALYSCPIMHPRSHHSTVEFLARYVRDGGVMGIEEGIRKLTGANADRIGLTDRGYIREGYRADMILLDLDELSAREDGTNEGFSYILLNGKTVFDGNSWLTPRTGEVITRFRTSE